MNFDKYKVWALTLPQLNYYLKKCRKHVEFSIKVYGNPLSSMFGGGVAGPTVEAQGTDDGEYEEATADGLDFLARLL